MKNKGMYLGGLCLITDKKICHLTCIEMTRLALMSGVRWVQYRAKDKSRLEVYHEAMHLRELTRAFGARLIVNDYADIALCVEADGVHLGQEDLPLQAARRILGEKRVIGISCHNVAEAVEAERGGADYIGFGPVFHTKTKDAGAPRGPAALAEIKRAVGVPVVAVGGINSGNVTEVISAGADAVASAEGLLKGDVERNVRMFLDGLGEKM